MNKKWYHFLSSSLQPLALLSMQLLKREKEQSLELANYDFIVFPLAKAYETFLKDYLFSLKLIPERIYRSKKFSIGRSLNPDVRLEQRDEFWLYDDLHRLCGEHVAREIWDAWLMRNRLIHLYPGEVQSTSLAQAENKINQLIRVIELCGHCAFENGGGKK